MAERAGIAILEPCDEYVDVARSMRAPWKDVDEIGPADRLVSPVWEFNLEDADEGLTDTAIRPVETSPVDDLANRIVMTLVRLSSGLEVEAMLGISIYDRPRLRSTFCF